MLKYLIVSIVFIICLNNAWATALQPVKLQLKWKHQFQFAGYYAAKAKGFYQEAGFDVTILEHNLKTSPIEQLINDDVDFAVADSSVVLNRIYKLPVVVVTTIFQQSPLTLISKKSSNINSPYELKGKKISYQVGIDGAAISAMFHHLQLTENDYELVPFTFNDKALLESDIDAMAVYSTNQIYLYEQLGVAINRFDPINYGIDFYGDLLITNEKWVTTNYDKVDAFRIASLKGWQYALEHPEEIVDLILSEYGSEKTKDHLLWEAAQTEKVILSKVVPIGTTHKIRFKRIADIYRQELNIQIGSRLDGLLMQDYVKQPSLWPFWFKLVASFAAVLLLLSLILIFLNRHLKKLVNKQTNELQNYVQILDENVIHSQLDKQGKLTSISSRFSHISGYHQSELLGKHQNHTLHPDVDTKIKDSLNQALELFEPWQGELLHRNKANKTYWTFSTINPIINDDNELSGFACIDNDITDKKRIETLSVLDSLTGIYNRSYLDGKLASEWQRHLRKPQSICIIIIDLDHFKKINDTFGHLVGDEVLKQLSQLMKNRMRINDTLGRWGGEEFMIICPNTKLDGGMRLAKDIKTSINESHFDIVGTVTASFGVAITTSETHEINALIKAADDAMYKAKEGGRDQIQCAH